MTTTHDRAKLAVYIASLLEMHPQMRCGQVLSNLDTWMRARTSIDLFYIDDEQLLRELYRMIQERYDEPKLAGWDVT